MPSLLSIAPELRVGICAYVFVDALAEPAVHRSPIHPVLQICSQLRDENTAVYYQQVQAALAASSTQLIELGPTFFSAMLSGQDVAPLAAELESVGRRCEMLKQIAAKLDAMELFQQLGCAERVEAGAADVVDAKPSPFDAFQASGQFGSATACVVPSSGAAAVEKTGIFLGPAGM